MCWTLFSGLQLYQKRLQERCFPVNIAKFLRTPMFLQTAASL